MANLVITSTTNSIKVDFGDTPISGIIKGTWRKDKIISFRLQSDRIAVITMGAEFEVSNAEAAGALVVDTVDGVAPSSLADLYDKLAALVA